MNSGPEHEQYQFMLGAYVLGGLDPADRAAVDAHMAQCASCRRELAEFAVVPGLLSRAPEPGTEQPLDSPSVALQGAVRSLSAARRAKRRLVAAGVAGVAACGLAAGFAIGAVTASPSGPEEAVAQRSVALAASRSAMGGSADLASRPWGTEMRLKLHDLPAGQRLKVIVVGVGGRGEPAASWSVPGAGKSQLTGAISMQPDSVRRIEIQTDNGTVLASSAN